jgi:hypothetical protein
VTLVIDVANVNDPPTIEEMGPITSLEGKSVSLRLVYDDKDLSQDLQVPERLTVTSDGPGYLHAGPNGWVNVTLDQSMVGDHTVTYTVTDREGLSASIQVQWSVLNVNEGPVIVTDVPGSIDTLEDEEFAMTLMGTDADGDTLTWSDQTALFDIEPDTGAISFTPTQEQVGNYVVTLTVSDGNGGSASVSFDLMVVNVNDPPVINEVLPLNGSVYDEGYMVTFSASAMDEDGDVLTYLWLDGTKGLGAGSPLKVKDLSPGIHTITVVVSDGTTQVEQTMTLVIEGSATSELDEGLPWPIIIGLLVGVVMVVLALLTYLGRGDQG